MNTYDIAIRLTDGIRKTMTVRATTANAAERLSLQFLCGICQGYTILKCPTFGTNKEQSKNKFQLLIKSNYETKSTNSS